MSDTAPLKRAILYLRVSSRGQLETDFDDDGLSIAAQRARCTDEAEKLGAVVVDEYIERAESAKTTGRPELQKMLKRVQQHRDVDYVIVYKVDRFARNRRDDANMVYDLRSVGAQLVSATENIEDTPIGRLTHGMMAVFSEFYSDNLASEVIKGATEKAKRGGTPGRVPPGYLNRRDFSTGSEVRVVQLDPEREHHIRWAFECYATGRYSIADLVALLEARGLRSRRTKRCEPRPLGHTTVADILANDYYVGIVTYRGQKFTGRHEPLVTRETFDRVQAVLKAHKASGERDRKHKHYLKGTVFCAGCGRRLTYSRNTGRNGTAYEYFVCSSQQKGLCVQGYQPVPLIEEAIERHYATVSITPAERDQTREALRQHLGALAMVAEQEIARCEKVLTNLREEERKLLRATTRGFSTDVINDEVTRIAREREQAQAIINRLSIGHQDIQKTIDLGLDLLGQDLQSLYLRADDTTRRIMNQALFSAIWIAEDGVEGSQLTQEIAEVVNLAKARKNGQSASAAPSLGSGASGTKNPEAPDSAGESGASVGGSIRTEMVELAGLEPATSWVRSTKAAAERGAELAGDSRGHRRRATAADVRGSRRFRHSVTGRRARELRAGAEAAGDSWWVSGAGRHHRGVRCAARSPRACRRARGRGHDRCLDVRTRCRRVRGVAAYRPSAAREPGWSSRTRRRLWRSARAGVLR